MEDIKPCPFCGCSDINLEYKGELDPPCEYEENWIIECFHCGASPTSDRESKERAIEIWNTRTNESNDKGE